MPEHQGRAAIDDALTTLQSAAAATGNGTPLDVKGWAVVAVQVTGSFSATITFEVTLDGSTWVSAQAVNVATGATATTATAAADYLVAVAGFEYFRTRVTWTSGTSVTTKARCTPFDSSVVNAAAGAETVTANQGSAAVGITASGVTSTQTGTDQTNYNHRGVKVTLDMTVIGTGSVTLEIDGKDEVSGKYYAILTGAAVVSNSTNVYTVYPGIATAANAQASDVLPRIWRVKVTANNANATTYTVGASLIL